MSTSSGQVVDNPGSAQTQQFAFRCGYRFWDLYYGTQVV